MMTKPRTMAEDPWSGIQPSMKRLVGRRVEQSHPLDVYWVRSVDGSPGLLVRGMDSSCVPAGLPKPRGLALDVIEGAGAVEASMFLREPDDREVFRTLCHDVIAYSGAERSSQAATYSFFRRLAHWHSMLTRARTTAMAPHEVRGLMGELYVLERLMDRLEFGGAVKAWVAPDDHPQDFALNSRIVEVKTRISGARSQVQISSLDQLESAHLPLALVVVELVHSTSDEAFSLNDLCGRLEDVACGLGVAQEDALHGALLRRGYIRQDAYDVDTYRVVGASAFDVREGFPRLVRKAVDPRISEARYTLDLALTEEFAMDAEKALD